MERENEPDNLDINDYHRLRYLGDNVNEILQSVLENIRAGIGLFEVGESIRALYLNDAYFQCIGYSKEDYDKEIQDVLSTLLPEDAAGFLACISENAPKGRSIYYIIRGYRKNGEIGWFEVKGEPLENHIGKNPIYLTVISDITAEKESEAQVRELKQINDELTLQQERYKILEATAMGLLFEYYPEKDTMVFSYNLPGNKKRREVRNYSVHMKNSPFVHSSHQKMFCEALQEACKGEVDKNLEYLSSISGGGYRWHRTHYKSILDNEGKVISVIGRIQDIHEEYMAKAKLNYRAETDGLTGLYRKEAAFEKMREYMVEAPKEVYYFSLVDLDHFKQINDLHGHQYGDRILQQTSQALSAGFGESAVIGRFGGDEFIILTRGLSEEEVRQILLKVREQCSFCFGTVKTGAEDPLMEVFEEADKRMYHQKALRKEEN